MVTASPPQWIDWDKLAAPVSEEEPEGESLRYEGTYDQIQEARRRDDPNLAQGVWETRLKQADWDKVIQLGVRALETRTKDLQIAVWVLEAWVHRFGFEGVQQGLELLFRLCEGFWDTVYPKMEDGDYEARVRPFEWINEKLTVQLKLIPLSAPTLHDHVPYNFADYELAGRNENQARKSQEAKDRLETDLSYARFFASCDLTPPEFYQKLVACVEGARDRLRNLEGYLDDRCGKQSPSLLKFREVLKSVSRLLHEILQRRGLNSEASAPVAAAEPETPSEEDQTVTSEPVPATENPAGPDTVSDPAAGEAPAGPAAPVPSGPIRTRREAYRRLEEIADFLHQIEPHSPTPYLIRRAVAWGNMTLDQLLLEIVRDDNDLRFIYELLGIQGDQSEHPEE